MQRNSKVAIMIVFVIVAVFVWVPKGRKAEDASSTTSSVTLAQAIPVTRAVPRKRTQFVGWGRNPFTFPQREEEVGSVSNLRLHCIIVTDEGAQAFINELIVRVGDKIADKAVKQIEQNRVVLTDGIKDYVLELRK